MRQVIVSKIGAATKTAVGAPQLQTLDANGVWTLWSAASTATDPLYRIYKAGDADNAEQISPAFRKSAIVDFDLLHYSEGKAQVNLLEVTAAGTETKNFVFKMIDVSNGYEPFARVNVEAKAGADDDGTASNLKTALDAELALGGVMADFVDTIALGTSSNAHKITVTAKKGKRIEIALDAQESAVAISNTKSDGEAGIGDGVDIIEEEKLQQGREYSGYDRLVAFDSFADVVVAVTGQTYHLAKFLVKNQTPNQINGVDNMREIKVYLEESATSDVYDFNNESGSGGAGNAGFARALFGEGLISAVSDLDG